MIILDFLVYYLTYWFEKKKKNLVWSTPIKRAIYGIMLASAGICVFIEKVILEGVVWKNSGFSISLYLYLILVVGFNYVLEYIYIKKGRYERISVKGFKLPKYIGVTISILIIFICTIGWLFIYMLIVPAGSGKK